MIDSIRSLNFVNNFKQCKNGDRGYDAFCKVRQIVEHLLAVFPHYYQPAHHLSVDEMIGSDADYHSSNNYPKNQLR